MKKYKEVIKKGLVRFSATVLPMFAIIFAMSPCICKMYEPDMPEELIR